MDPREDTVMESGNYQANPSAPKNLRCEYTVSPLGIDVDKPRLSWEVNDLRRGAVQSAYQVLVAENTVELEQNNGVVWDSGKVQSGQSSQITYCGSPLQSCKRYYWTVRTWDAEDNPSTYSEAAWWEMGLLNADDWKAGWISAPQKKSPELLPMGKWIWHPDMANEKNIFYFRYEFTIPDVSKVVEARIQTAGDITHILHINGVQAGAMDGAVLIEHDISAFIKSGLNVIAIEGRRFAENKGVLAGGLIRYSDGTSTQILTDSSWITSGKLSAGWNETGFAGFEDGVNAVEIGSCGDDPWGKMEIRNDPFQPAPFFRKDFVLSGDIKRARAYICGLGYNELYLNGKRIGDSVLDPGQTDYDKRAFYVTHDITGLLKSGNNAAGVILGDGFYNQTAIWGGMSYGDSVFILQIAVDYEDGSSELFVSDQSWKSATGPILMNNVYAGETYDSRLEINGWSETGFDDSEWSGVRIMDSPTAMLVAQDIPPIKRMGSIKPVAITNPKPGVYIFDMGQNFAGWTKLSIEAPAGTEIKLRSTEMLTPDGMLEPSTTGDYHTHWIQTEKYICSGKGLEVWEPRFAYHGFRYVEMTGFPGVPSLENLEGIVVHSSVEKSGSFECSDALINKIHDAAIWTEISNLHSIATDCPHREKCGWLGDAHISAETTIYNFNMVKFWSKFMKDINTTMVDGRPSMVAPGKRLCGFASVDWGTAIIQLPWYLYLFYGDTRVIEEQYQYWRKWIDHVLSITGESLIVEGKGWEYSLGDWCPPGGNNSMECPPELTATAFFYFDAWIASKTAGILGMTKDSEEYALLAENIKQAFIGKYFDSGKSTYGSQTADAVALHLNLVPDGRAADLAESLAENVKQHDGGITTGIMGIKYLFGALADHFHDRTAFSILTKTDYPSIGNTFSLGATTLWEVFGEGFVNPTPDYSLNHPMQGGFDGWFYSGVCGIGADPDQPGFKHIILRPAMTGELDWTRASYDSVHGTIKSEWCNKTGNFRWRILIPANTTATVYIPCSEKDTVKESGKPASDAESVSFVKYEAGYAVYNTGAGDYDFCVCN